MEFWKIIRKTSKPAKASDKVAQSNKKRKSLVARTSTLLLGRKSSSSDVPAVPLPSSPPPPASPPSLDSNNISDPDNVERTLHVEWDPKTGTFKGLPDCWADLLPVGTVRNVKKSQQSNTATGGQTNDEDSSYGKLLPVKPNKRIRNSIVAKDGGVSLLSSKEPGFIKR